MTPLYDFFARGAESGLLPIAFEHGFMVRALVAALVAGPMLAALGTVVVARRLVFFTEVLGHAALTGVALGLWLGEPAGQTWVGLFGFCMATALVLEYLRRTARLPHETLTGVVLVGSLGLGLWLLSTATRGFDLHQVEGVLFGSPLGVGEDDLALLAAVAAGVAVLGWRHWNALLLSSVSPPLHRLKGRSGEQLGRPGTGRPADDTAALDYGFVVVLTIVVVASLELVGALLVLALVAVPAAAAQTLARGLRSYFWISVGLGLLAALGGLWTSAVGSLPPGGGIALWSVGQFVLARLAAIALGLSTPRQVRTPW